MEHLAPVEELLAKVFDGAREGLRAELTGDEYKSRRNEFVFHLTEVREDLARLAELLAKPEKLSEEAASSMIIGFLYHSIPHLNAAGRLLLDHIDDPFTNEGR